MSDVKLTIAAHRLRIELDRHSDPELMWPESPYTPEQHADVIAKPVQFIADLQRIARWAVAELEKRAAAEADGEYTEHSPMETGETS